MYVRQGKQREAGIGSGRNGDPNYRTLAEARAKAAEARKLLAEGKDPIAEWNRPDAEAVPTFGAMADSYVEAHKGSWRNEKHAAQWTMTLDDLLRGNPQASRGQDRYRSRPFGPEAALGPGAGNGLALAGAHRSRVGRGQGEGPHRA